MRRGDEKSVSSLFEAALLVLVTAAFLFYDPFRINFRLTNILRLKFAIFTREPKLLSYAYMYMGSFIAKASALVLICLLILSRREGLRERLRVNKPASDKWREHLLPFAILGVIIRIYYSANPLLPNLPIRLIFPESMLIGNTVIISSVILIAPITEEVIFRGYLFDGLKRNFGPNTAILLTSILFAVAHIKQLGFEILPGVIIFILGALFCITREKTNSILIPILFHGLYNLIYVLVGTLNYFLLGY